MSWTAGIAQVLVAVSVKTTNVAVPDGAKQKQIPAVANDPAPTNTTSCARVTLDRRSGRWLVSQFEPI